MQLVKYKFIIVIYENILLFIKYKNILTIINKKNFNWKIYLMFMILILFYNKITKFYYKK